MKKSIFILGILLLLSHLTFSQGRNLEPFKPEKDMVEMEILKPTVSLKKGQKAYLQYTVFGSVGIYGEYDIDDESIIKQVSSLVTYEKAHTDGMTGDDRSTATLVFEALKPGKTILKFRDMFRGEVKSEYKFKITVQE